jgi:hypothetical protein
MYHFICRIMKRCILLCSGLFLFLTGLQSQLSTEALILNAQVLNADSVKVDSETLKVFLYMPYGYDIRTLAPAFQISPQATISPASGSTWNFTSPVSYTVTAEDGTTKMTYSVEVFVPTVTLSRLLTQGWNWISLSVVPPDPNLSSVLGSLLQYSPGFPVHQLTNLDYIKSATASAVYYTSIGWFGELSNLPQYEVLMFKITAVSAKIFRLIGKEINPTITTIPVSAGWNRIGFILKGNARIGEVFEPTTLPAGNILLKSKESSSWYYPASGWAGDLDSLRVLTGYMMKTTASGAIRYRASSAHLAHVTQFVIPRKELNRDYQIDPLEYQNSANLIAELVNQNGEYITRKGDLLIASSKSETRGVTEAIFVPELNRYIFLLMMFSNLNQENLSFSIKSLSDDREKPLSTELIFSPDEVYGMAMNPLPLNLSNSASTADVSNNTLLASISDLLKKYSNEKIYP